MSLIIDFDPWSSSLCTCPKKYSLSAYTGCGHGCLYCYASSYIRDFSNSREKKDFLGRLQKEIKKIPSGSIIAMANSSDPYLPLEEKLKLTQSALKILKNYSIKLNIVTKSSLIIRDLELLKEFKAVVISLSFTTLDENLSRKLEPLAPKPKERLQTIEKLSKFIPVAVRLDPLIFPLNTENIKKTIKAIKNVGARQIITSTYKAKPDNYKKMTDAFSEHKAVWDQLYLRRGERLNRYIYLPKKLREELIGKIRKAALEESLNFSSCREGFANLNTVNCDGTSLV